jgi:ATP-dependent exoDNAse (exonuclease V) alpha subunit
MSNYSDQISTLITNHFAFSPTEDQQKAIELLSLFLSDFTIDNLFILRGYAGTGKTSLVSTIVNILPQIQKRAVLLAPTGRAAKVLSGYAHKPASTIHRKIYRMNSQNGISFSSVALQENKHTNTLFIVDEASMISDTHQGNDGFDSRNILDDLIEYTYSGFQCKLLLVGDSAQLPPIGSELSTAIDASQMEKKYGYDITSYELKEVLRQQQDSGILANATYLRRQIELKKITGKLFKTIGFTDIVNIDGNELEDALNQAYSHYETDEIAIITRTNKRANLFNKEIRSRILYKDSELSTGDYMMVVKNNYFWLPEESTAGFIANGDILEIRKVSKRQSMYDFDFVDTTFTMCDYPDHEPVEARLLTTTIDSEAPALTREEQNQLYQKVNEDYSEIQSKAKRYASIKKDPWYNAIQVKFAYALTCHKTQGGQWKVVFIDQGYLTKEMVNKEYLRWLYTAITRATEKVYLINFHSDFFITGDEKKKG